MKKFKKFPICMLFLSIMFGINSFVFSQDNTTMQEEKLAGIAVHSEQNNGGNNQGPLNGSQNGVVGVVQRRAETEEGKEALNNVNNYLNNNDNKSNPGTEKKECPNGCCGIKLNTNFPIIGNCIGDKESENPTNAFPTMIGAITKIVMSLIFVVCFILIIISGIMRASDNPSGAKNLLKKVAVTILILGLSGVILRLINPNFFS